MKHFWDERYSADDYVYGENPNTFFKDHLDRLECGKLLLPGEGEGRNAVYAAKNGWEVTAFDQSSAAIIKAKKLADKHQISFDYQHVDFNEFQTPEYQFDCVALIFVHLPPDERVELHSKVINYLKPGGMLLLEAFEKAQLENNTGGPKSVEMLFSKRELAADFKALTDFEIKLERIHLSEGRFHDGVADVIRVIGHR